MAKKRFEPQTRTRVRVKAARAVVRAVTISANVPCRHCTAPNNVTRIICQRCGRNLHKNYGMIEAED